MHAKFIVNCLKLKLKLLLSKVHVRILMSIKLHVAWLELLKIHVHVNR